MLKQWRIATLVVTVAIAISVFISACGGSSSSGSSGSNGSSNTPSSGSSSSSGTPGSYSCVQSSITASGSTALAPLVTAVAKQYQAKCSGSSITVNLGGSGTGLSQVESGQVQIGNSDIFAKSNQTGLIDHQVAVVVFALIVNKDVMGVKSLTADQIKGIYSGATKNWSEVGGPNLPIVVVSRPTSSGTRATFQKYVLGTVETITGPSSLTTDSTGTVVTNVEKTGGAIGYVALSAAKQAQQAGQVTIIQIDGKDATSDNVKDNSYKFWNIEHMYTKGQPVPLAQALIDYMTSPTGKEEAQKLDFVPITDMQSSALQTRQPTS